MGPNSTPDTAHHAEGDPWPPERTGKEKSAAAREELFGNTVATLLRRICHDAVRDQLNQLESKDLCVSIMERHGVDEDGTMQERDRFALVASTQDDSNPDGAASDAGAEGPGAETRSATRYHIWMAFHRMLGEWKNDDVHFSVPVRIRVHHGLAAELINGMSPEHRRNLADDLVHTFIRGERDEDNYAEMEDGGVFPDWREEDDPYVAFEHEGLRTFHEQMRAGTLPDS